jgi:hypothetical protein
MNEQETNQPNAGARQPNVIHERCLCREVMDQMREVLGVPPQVREHFNNSRIEFLKGLRAIIDSRIEHLSQAGANRGTKIAVE